MAAKETLIVRHLPAGLSECDCVELLKHFGATSVKYMGNNGSMKHTAFAKFGNKDSATNAMRKLHQLEILGSRLVVVYSTDSMAQFHPSELDETKPMKNISTKDTSAADRQAEIQKAKEMEKEKESEHKRKVAKKINSVSNFWNFEYTFNTKLKYMYPAPTITILTNIANALATVPKFYVQVLHLMNKMNLPAPFGLLTITPPIPDGFQPPLPPDAVAPPEPISSQNMEYSSGEESEIESEAETEKVEKEISEVGTKKRLRKEKKQSSRKKLKLQLQMDVQMQEFIGIMPRSVAVPQKPTDVFEKSDQMAAKKIEFKITADSVNNVQESHGNMAVSEDKELEEQVQDDNKLVETGGFGKILPELKPKVTVDDAGDDLEWGDQEFVSEEELRKGRLSEKELKSFSAFKNYNPGDTTTRLYIKNLTKQVKEKDLHYIFGKYVNWQNNDEKIMYDIRLMTEGKMKGQAFITLPSEKKAEEAVRDTNGFSLYGKPIVVSFARSAKPKETTDNVCKK